MKREMTIKFRKELTVIHSRHVRSLNSVWMLSKQLRLFHYETEMEEEEAFRFWK